MTKNTLIYYLSFLRFPSIFSSASNVYLGYFLCSKNFQFSTLTLGIIASIFSILAGMGFNDIADVKIDAVQRPNRPLPSKKVSIFKAWLICLFLSLSSFILYYLANPKSLPFVFLLWIFILSYNFYFKNTPWGFIPMALCRGLNILIGISLAGISLSELPSLSYLTWLSILSLIFYIALVTFLAKDEVIGNKPWKIVTFCLGLVLWFILWIIILSTQEYILPSVFGILLLAWYGFKIKPLLTNVIRNPKSSVHNQKVIGFCLWLIPLVDSLALLQQNHLWLTIFPLCCLFLSKYTRFWFHLT